MTDQPTRQLDTDDQFAEKLVKVGGFAVLFALLVFLFYLFKFHRLEISANPSDWGTFGDYIGGIVNPIVGLATIVLVIFSINIQRRELRASLNEMRLANQATKQISLEQTLFAWINNYHALTSSVSIEGYKGRQAMQWLYDNNLSERTTILFHPLPPELQVAAQINPNEAYLRIDVPGDQGLKQVAPFFFKAVLKFQGIAYKYKSELDAPISTLLQILEWIDQSALSNEGKWHYRTVLKSQLSWIELVFLFYTNLITNEEHFAELTNKYAMLDKLVRDDFLLLFAETRITPTPHDRHPQFRDARKPWPYKSTAFNPEEAKKSLGL